MKNTVRCMLGIKREMKISITNIIKNELKWFLPHQIYTYKCMCTIRHIIQNDIPYFENLFVKNSDIHSYSTRKENDLHAHFRPMNKISSQTICFAPLHAWNQLSNEIKSCTNINTFKHKLKSFLLSNWISHLLWCIIITDIIYIYIIFDKMYVHLILYLYESLYFSFYDFFNYDICIYSIILISYVTCCNYDSKYGNKYNTIQYNQERKKKKKNDERVGQVRMLWLTWELI